jgi:hypothetical protein
MFPFTPHTTLRLNLWVWAVPFLKGFLVEHHFACRLL